MGILEKILKRSGKRESIKVKPVKRAHVVRKYVSLADSESIKKIASKKKLIKWFSIDGVTRYILAGKSKTEIIEDEIIRLTDGVITLQKLLGRMNAKVAALEKRLGIDKKASDDLTLADVLGKPEEGQGTTETTETTETAETTSPETTTETTESTEVKEEAPAEGEKTEETKTETTGGGTISINVEDIKKFINKDVKGLNFKGVNISSDGKVEAVFEVETAEGTVTASIEKSPNGEIIYKEAAGDPTKFVSKYKFDPVTKMVTPMPSGEGPKVMVEVDKKSMPKGEVVCAAEDVEKSQKPTGKVEVAVSEPKSKKASVYNLARAIVSTAAKKGIIPNDPDQLSVRLASLIEKDEEELQSILDLIEVVDPEVTIMDEEGNIYDLKEIKENIE